MNTALERVIVQMATLSLLDQRTNNITDGIMTSHDMDQVNFNEIVSVLENVITRLINI